MVKPRLYCHIGSLELGVGTTMMQQKYNNHPAITDLHVFISRTRKQYLRNHPLPTEEREIEIDTTIRKAERLRSPRNQFRTSSSNRNSNYHVHERFWIRIFFTAVRPKSAQQMCRTTKLWCSLLQLRRWNIVSTAHWSNYRWNWTPVENSFVVLCVTPIVDVDPYQMPRKIEIDERPGTKRTESGWVQPSDITKNIPSVCTGRCSINWPN